MVSIRSLLWEAFHSDTNRFPETRDLSKGQEAFIRQLCWREFFIHIAFHFPYSLTQVFDPKWNKLTWENDEQLFTHWKQATTGFPLIDAGMRELNATGYMHSVARTMAAGFLTKYLLIDWRKGEQYFAQHLIDYDPALSVGNWQLAAGTGASAQPHFLILKPDYQPHTDLHGYVDHWVPEYRSASYPAPIIDTKQRRVQALAMYEQALQ
jgi:deoxyribodipyrimidine photo-lyase